MKKNRKGLVWKNTKIAKKIKAEKTPASCFRAYKAGGWPIEEIKPKVMTTFEKEMLDPAFKEAFDREYEEFFRNEAAHE